MRSVNKYGWHYAVLAFVLSGIGLLFIYSASSYSAQTHYGDSLFFVKKQAIALGIGVFMFLAGRFMPINVLRKFKWVVLGLSIVLLALVYVPGLGLSSYGATRWISLGFITFQPSEISKFGLMVFLAGYFEKYPPTTLKNLLIPFGATVAVCGLVITEPNMSITMVIGLSVLVLLFVAGIDKKYMIVLFCVVVAAGVALIFAEPYRLKRLTAFLDPWENPKAEGYQLIQSFYAISSGGLFGKGVFQSTQKLLFLPFAESDFIFSIIAEETGLLGCFCLIILFFLLIFSGIRTSMNSLTRYETFLSAGLTAVIAWQTIINILVVTGCIPPTGVPLPFVSSGGSSLLSFLFVTGILSGISSRTKKGFGT